MSDLSSQQRDRLEDAVRQLARFGGVDRLRNIAGLVGLVGEQVRRVLEDERGPEGELDARVVIRVLPRRDVQRLLPAGLQLAPQPLVMPDRHPVFLSFAHERFDPRMGELEYRELTLGVPWVELADPHVPNRGPFIYMPQGYVDDPSVRKLSTRLYGFEQDLARMEVTADSHAAHAEPGGELLVHGRFEEDLDAAVHPRAMPSFVPVREIFEQPIISQARRIYDTHAFHHHVGGPFWASTKVYDFDAERAQLIPMRATVRVTGDFDAIGFPTSEFTADALGDQALGAFRMRVPQRLSLPQSPRTVRYPEPAEPPPRKRVVVLGAGPSSCAAAFYLAKTGRYDVSMYTLGFRMGGKCAAGRNATAANRIEEHGLHAFVGFYNNAFRTVREVYEQAELPLSRGQGPWSAEDLARGDGPFAEAFTGTNAVGLMGRWQDRRGAERWRYFPTTLPVNDSVPGEVPHDASQDGPQGFARALKITIQRALGHARELPDWAPQGAGEVAVEPPDLFDRVLDRIDGIGRRIVPSVDMEQWALYKFIERALGYIERYTFEDATRAIRTNTRLMRMLTRALRRLRKRARESFSDEIFEDQDRWFEWSGLDVMLTIAIGVLTDRVTHFDQIDHIDFCDWLRLHGISKGNDRSPVVLAVYDTLFSNGTSSAAPDNLAAGVGLRWFLLLLDYRGFQAYTFRYSCPQTLFSPYYRALTKLGVRVHFFHRVEALHVGRDGDDRRLTGITFRKQATVKAGPDAYDPLWLPHVPGNPEGLPPWPNRPDYSQLKEGETLADVDLEDAWDPRSAGTADPVTLEQGTDFDLCVCGLPLGALPAVAGDLIDRRSPAYSEVWARMIDGMELCQTVSMQLWMERPEAEQYTLPDRRGVPPHRGLLTEFAPPEPSFANFTHLVQFEDWASDDRIDTPPAYLAYHTGALTSGHPLQGHPFTDHEYPARVQSKWRVDASQWLSQHYRLFFDRAPQQFPDFCDQMVAPRELRGHERLAWQYFHVGMQPWDLYVLSQPGRIDLRLGQSESWCKDLFVCGDWTRTDINAGCVEAATQSGMLCARVLSQHPRYVWHTGF